MATKTYYLNEKKDRALLAWLRSKQNQSEIVKQALLDYRNREGKVEDKTYNAVLQLLVVLAKNDPEAQAVLESLMDKK